MAANDFLKVQLEQCRKYKMSMKHIEMKLQSKRNVGCIEKSVYFFKRFVLCQIFSVLLLCVYVCVEWVDSDLIRQHSSKLTRFTSDHKCFIPNITFIFSLCMFSDQVTFALDFFVSIYRHSDHIVFKSLIKSSQVIRLFDAHYSRKNAQKFNHFE